ncbi:MAG: relaxase/mobilization nuclease domain-containing protein [Eubacterium sp.]|nr:relaxase/mobilization nuclease domain-containing protein [Eubacterium sp.]
MAYTKLTPIKSTDHFRKTLSYIQRPEKTNNGQLVDSYECIPQAAENLFALVRSKEVIKKGNNIAWHIYQSFAPEDNITPEQALEIGKELMKRMYPDFQYVIATHIDRQHLHNHILVNAVDFRTFHKLHSNKKTYARLKAISDDICLEHKLSIIDKDGTMEQRRQLREIALSETEIFLNKTDYIKNWDNIKNNILSEIKTYIGSDTKLSADIENNITEGFQRFQAQIEKHKNTETYHKGLDEIILSAIEKSFDGKQKTHKQRLQENLDKAIDEAADFFDFIANMQDMGYVIKMGKYLSFKDRQMQRFIRSTSISRDYSEAAIKYRIKNKGTRQPSHNRKVYDDKYNFGKRKRLKNEIDSAIRRSNTFEEFITDMESRDFEVKQGKYLAFKRSYPAVNSDNEPRFIRSKSMGYDYAEEVIKFRIENKEEYKQIVQDKVKDIIPVKEYDNANIKSWKNAKNVSLSTETTLWVVKQVLGRYGVSFKDYTESKIKFNEFELFGALLESYDIQKSAIKATEENLANADRHIAEISKNIEADTFNKQASNDTLNNWKTARNRIQTDLVRLKLDFENYETAKANYLSKDGYGFLFDTYENFEELARNVWKQRKDADIHKWQNRQYEKYKKEPQTVKHSRYNDLGR